MSDETETEVVATGEVVVGEPDTEPGQVGQAGQAGQALASAAPVIDADVAEYRRLTRQPTEEDAAALEAALLSSDFGRLSGPMRRALLASICKTLGVKMELRPFVWGTVKDGAGNKKLVPIPTKALYSQQRANHGITTWIKDMRLNSRLGVFVVHMGGVSALGVEDEDIGVSGVKGGGDTGTIVGDALADAMMTAITKAKNRLTASMVGGMQAPSDEELTSMLKQEKQRSGEAGGDGSGPRRIDPNRGKMVIDGEGVEAYRVLVAARREEVEGLDTEAIPEVGTRAATATTAPAPAAAGGPPPVRLPGGGPPPAAAVTPPKPEGEVESLAPAAAGTAGPTPPQPPRPAAPRPPGAPPAARPAGGAPPPAPKANPAAQPAKAAPGAPKPPTPSPVKARPTGGKA